MLYDEVVCNRMGKLTADRGTNTISFFFEMEST